MTAAADLARDAGNENVDEEERRRRQRERELEELMLRQELEEQQQQQQQQQQHDEMLHDAIQDQQHQRLLENGENEGQGGNNIGAMVPVDGNAVAPRGDAVDGVFIPAPSPRNKISYTQASFVAALALLWYALRTRQQWYLALVYLSSSKWAYLIMGNALIAFNVWLFQVITSTFLGELRLLEREGLGDFFRWNVTETCLALTMFRTELDVSSGILFLFLILNKCLHWVVELREQHLRMTQEAVIRGWNGFPKVHPAHFRLYCCLQLFLLIDVMAVAHCAFDIYQRGTTIYLLFCFESAILLVSAMSMQLLWMIHCVDSLLHYINEEMTQHNISGILHAWKDRRATVVFALQVQSQATKFFLYVVFFGIVLTFHGLPINLFREVYLSFQALKNRLIAFGKYRKLMQSMNRFASLKSEEELDEAGRTCIICRDEMTLRDCKKLPGCGHVFHKSCLREWLVQQQSCPTCRADITRNEARQRREEREAAEAAAAAPPAAAAEEATENADGGDEAKPASGLERSDDETKHQPECPPPTPPPTADTGSNHDRGLAFVRCAEEEADHRPRGDVYSTARGLVLPPQEMPAQAAKEDAVEAATEDAVGQPIADGFPAIYKVVNPDGALIFRSKSTSDLVRVVPCGTAILCFSMEWKSSTATDASGGLMLKMPDGWVWEFDVERIMPVEMPTE